MAIEAGIKVRPLAHSAGFGAEVTSIDLNNLSEDDFQALERALYTHKLLVIREQHDLRPKKQFELVRRFDPEAKPIHGHGDAKQVMQAHKGKKSLVGANPSVPEEPMVRFIGRTTIPAGAYGAQEPIDLKSSSHKGFHKEPLSDEEIEAGMSRFARWHIDAAFYRAHPPRVTSLWAKIMPEAPEVTVRWDDGSGETMKAQPGRTAFIDSTQLYASLSEGDKAWVRHSRVRYAPSPYQWIQDAKAAGNGFTMVSEGKEAAFEDLPSNDPECIMEYPMVWPNPYTGELALSVHAIIATHLIKKTSADGPEELIDDVSKIREILYDLQRPFLRAENVLFSPQQDGDMALWWNRGCRHTAVEYPSSYPDRWCHQVHVPGSDNPGAPQLVQQQA